jgi:lipoate-protein ligase A
MAELTPLPENWRLLRTPPADGASNMATDLTLMDLARASGVGILRIYGWSQPTVSFGRNERTAGVYRANELSEAGLDVVRRPTGGRALLHAREVTYSVAMPISDQTRWLNAYDAVNLRLLRAMRSLGVPAHIATGSARPSREVPDNAPSAPLPSHDQGLVCFSGIAQGEIAVGDRKLVASSVWRERGAYLQHGSILISDDQSRLGDLMAARMAKPEPAATLSEWIPAELSATAITDWVEIALQDAFGDCGKSVRWSIPSEVQQQVAVTRLALLQSTWLWRR